MEKKMKKVRVKNCAMTQEVLNKLAKRSKIRSNIVECICMFHAIANDPDGVPMSAELRTELDNFLKAYDEK